MAIQTRSTIKSWFLRGLKPLAAQFSDWLDSYWHQNDAIPMASISGIDTAFASKADTATVTAIAPIVLPANTASWITPADFFMSKIVMFDTANPAAVSVGTTNGGQEVYEAQDMANAFASFAGDKYFAAATTLYFNNITPTTIIKIYK